MRNSTHCKKPGLRTLDSLRQFLHLGDLKISLSFFFFLKHNSSFSYFIGNLEMEGWGGGGGAGENKENKLGSGIGSQI